jgi:hypothetical protein
LEEFETLDHLGAWKGPALTAEEAHSKHSMVEFESMIEINERTKDMFELLSLASAD